MSTDVTVVCDQLTSASLCSEHTVPLSRVSDLEASCTGSGGTWGEGTCPGGSAGGCLTTAGDGEMILFYYSTDEAAVMQTCAENGQTYVAP